MYKSKLIQKRAAFKKISISPDMYDLLKRLEREDKMSANSLSKILYAAKTIKALLKLDLVDQDSNGVFTVSTKGKSLLELEPRFSGNSEDRYGNKIQVWKVNDMGNYVVNEKELKPLGPHHHPNFFTEENLSYENS